MGLEHTEFRVVDEGKFVFVPRDFRSWVGFETTVDFSIVSDHQVAAVHFSRKFGSLSQRDRLDRSSGPGCAEVFLLKIS